MENLPFFTGFLLFCERNLDLWDSRIQRSFPDLFLHNSSGVKDPHPQVPPPSHQLHCSFNPGCMQNKPGRCDMLSMTMKLHAILVMALLATPVLLVCWPQFVKKIPTAEIFHGIVGMDSPSRDDLGWCRTYKLTDLLGKSSKAQTNMPRYASVAVSMSKKRSSILLVNQTIHKTQKGSFRFAKNSRLDWLQLPKGWSSGKFFRSCILEATWAIVPIWIF